MTATKLLAKPIRERELENLKSKCEELKTKGLTPSMKVILVGEHPPSVIYTRNKKKFMESFGAECEIINKPETISEGEFLELLAQIGKRNDVHGCFVQLPLPSHLSHIPVGELIPAEKDVDGFHSKNLNYILHGDTGKKALVPCTPKGIITILDQNNISLEGKSAVVIGRSMIVGKPMAMLLTNRNATVTLCHSRTNDLASYTKTADIIISAVGRPKFLGQGYLRESGDQVIIDVAINHDENDKLCGDVDFEDVVDKVSAITPVPGGVGPMTILSLAQNLLIAAERSLIK